MPEFIEIDSVITLQRLRKNSQTLRFSTVLYSYENRISYFFILKDVALIFLIIAIVSFLTK